METAKDRILRLNLGNAHSEPRLESLSLANPLVDDKIFTALSSAIRLSRNETIVLPCHHLETKSRGRGWARKGRGNNVEWGERIKDGYIVGPGFWVIGGHDGFTRKGQNEWEVKNILVGEDLWTIAS